MKTILEEQPFNVLALLEDFKNMPTLDLQFFAEKNKIRFGLKNVHYAVITDSGTAITYAAPARYPGAVSLTLTANGEITEFTADDITYFSGDVNNGYDGTFTAADIPEDFETSVLGAEVDTVAGVMYETAKMKGKKFAILFEINGDLKPRRYVFYYCTASRPTVSGQTKEGATITPQTAELTFQSRPHPYTNDIKANTTSEAGTAYDTWYTAVHERAVEGGGS